MDDTARLAFDGESWVTPLGKFFIRWFPAQWTLKKRKRRKIFQAALYDVPDTMTYKSLLVDANAHPFLRDAKVKSYKLVKIPDGSTKLIAYFESWADLQHAKKMTVNWIGQELHWSHHAAPTSYTNKSKAKTISSKQPHKHHNKNSGDPAIGSNQIPITRSRYAHKGLTKNSKDKILKNNSVPTNPSPFKSPKQKEGKTKISKRSLMLEIASIKDQLNRLISTAT
jgi:hypothetical protein